MKKIRQYCGVFAAAFMAAWMLGACGKDQIVLTTGFADDEIFRVGGRNCSRAEVMVYLVTLHNQYEGAFGEGIWGVETEGVPLAESVKQTVLARLARIKMMNLMAEHYGVALEKEEESRIQKAADEYYGSLEKEEIAAMDGVKKGTIESMYEEYALAEKVYAYLIADVNPEISDDEARTLLLHQIVLPDMVQAQEVKGELEAGEEFDALAFHYNKDQELSVSFAKGVMPQEIEDVCFALGEGEYSDILATENGYVIYYCVSTYDREQTEAHKQEILQQRQKEAFQSIYDTFAAEQEVYLNDELWAQITVPEETSGDTVDFFDVYEKYAAE
ncbi:MAG: peptidyl-prolyl cis-trans isomerase [Lachnospiraceae bacterium]|nr:peptidyl-prolyl cis-trans isomerase [Lachnospiraceae bacterium]